MLAELVFYHSRPIAPTRRIALGESTLPGGTGVLLLAGVASTFGRELYIDDAIAVDAFVEAVRDRKPVDQPQLRHRYQTDTVGLTRSRHRLYDAGRFDFADHTASPLQHVLATVYAADRLGDNRERAFNALQAALQWRGPVDGSFLDAIEGHDGLVGDSVVWAHEVLGFDLDCEPDEREVRRRFRSLVAEAHPDVGGEVAQAAARIRELTEAKRLLVAVGASDG